MITPSRFSLVLLLLLLPISKVFAQPSAHISGHVVDSTDTASFGAVHEGVTRRHFTGSSLFVLVNLIPLSNPPHFYQLNYGYRLTPRDAVSVEAITWRYHAPLGIPYGPSLESPDEAYPGYVQEYGIGVAYQRFLPKGFYTALHALPLLQRYMTSDEEYIQKGFQLFLTLRFGYHLNLFQKRFFLEPNIAFTHWPVNTNVPESFARLEAKWPNYFLFEPGLHFGVKF